MSKDMIVIKGLEKSFGDLHVLKGVNLTIAEKEVVVIIGPSGSGKSTLLRCINFLEEPTGGSIVIDGIPLNGEANINEIRKEVGMVFQRFNLFPQHARQHRCGTAGGDRHQQRRAVDNRREDKRAQRLVVDHVHQAVTRLSGLGNASVEFAILRRCNHQHHAVDL